MTTGDITVLVCDSQSLICEGLVAILNRQPDVSVVDAVTSPDDAIARVLATRPSVVVIGHDPPALDAVELTSVIVVKQQKGAPGERPVAPVVLFHPSFPRGTLLQAVRAGARGMLGKNEAPRSLGATVRSAAAGSLTAVPPLDELFVADVVPATEAASALPTAMPFAGTLSHRELEVLRFVARGLTNSEIARELGLGVATVKSHFYSVCRKLGLRDRVQAVILAYECGLIRPATT